MSNKKLALYKETLRTLSAKESENIGAGVLRDSIEIRCLPQPTAIQFGCDYTDQRECVISNNRFCL